MTHENAFSEIPEEVLKELSSYDYYACEDTVFYICEHMITIKNSQLAEALLALPGDDQEILLMYWFLDMADHDIAKEKCMARRTVNYHRLKSYQLLKKLMGCETSE